MKTLLQKLTNLFFSSRLTVWLENRMIAAYSSPSRFTRRVVLSIWFLLYRVLLLVRTGTTFEITRLEGVPEGQNALITLIYFQSGRGMAFLSKAVFGDNSYQEARLGQCRLWNLPERVKAESPQADLVVVERNTLLKWVPDTGYWLRTPTWLSMAMELGPDEPWEIAKKRMRSQNNNIKMMKKKGFTYEVTRDPQAFEHFYERMYLPYINERYPGYGFTDDKNHLRSIFEQGFLAKICSAEGEYVAASVGLRRGDMHFAVALGVLDANTAWLEAGVLSALYYYLIHHAHQDGYRRVDFGGVRPFLHNGLYQYKYRWGMRPVLDYWNPREWLIWNPNGSSVAAQWLADNPIVPEYLRTGGEQTPAQPVEGSQP